jgi:large subunit ribosomal protein L30
MEDQQRGADTPNQGAALRITQVRSSNGRVENQKRTLRALGLGRIGRSVDRPDRVEIRGMIAKVAHLVTVENVEDEQ